jgi:hypothetical protein
MATAANKWFDYFQFYHILRYTNFRNITHSAVISSYYHLIDFNTIYNSFSKKLD